MLSKPHLAIAEQRVQAMFAEGLLPPAMRYSNIKWWVTQHSYLKSHDWQLMAGPVGCYLLSGLLGEPQQAAIFKMFGVFHRLMSKQFKRSSLQAIEQDAKAAIAELECVLPACESGILRHLVVHLAQRAQTAGPPWVHAMWPWERTWGHVVRWLKQKNAPATSIMIGFHALTMARAR